MKDAKVDTTELARAMGLSYQAVRKVLLGGEFSARNNAKAAAILGVSSDWLATGEGARARGGEGERVVVIAEGEAEQQLLDDFRVLMEDDQREFAGQIAALAAKMRAHNAKVLRSASAAVSAGGDMDATEEDERIVEAIAKDIQRPRPTRNPAKRSA